MKKITIKALLGFVVLNLTTACSSVATKTTEPAVKATINTLLASGYSPARNLPQLTQIQNRFAVEQAAKLNAYRELAKKLYRKKLSNQLSVAAQVIKDESYRIYLDIFLREAKVIESTMTANQHKVVLALDLTDRFYQCISATVAIVSRCLGEDNKIPFTRIGYQTATVATVNISCAAANCSDQLHVSGYSTNKNIVDQGLLNLGLYDSEWGVNSGIRTALRYFVITDLIFN